MAGRGRTSFQKKQKEQMRLEKRQQKAARKEARKAARVEGAGPVIEPYIDEMGPIDEDEQDAADDE